MQRIRSVTKFIVFTSICCECVCVHSFYEDLVFYDKDNIPEDIFLKIEERVNKPKFRVGLILTHYILEQFCKI